MVREQRRLVTVVFADVVGSTALAEELDPEDVRALFTRYYALAERVVTEHGGIVAKLLGDGVLACFGIPTAHGDDAQRALDAALALREAVSVDGPLSRITLRIGVNTGEVLANEDASGEIVGDAVNVAARVAAAAAEGEVLAADPTKRAAPGIAYGDARDIAAKGKSQPVRVWPVRGRDDAHAEMRTPFVGREDDLAQLELVARRAFRERRPYLVTITAPPGTGKSRLAHEFRVRLGSSADEAHAHCPPYGQMLAYGPLRDLLLDALALSADAAADDIRLHVAQVLAGPDAVRDAQLIASTIAPEGAQVEHEPTRVYAAWRRVLARLASERPLIVLLEDVQNAADSVLDLVEQIAQPGLEASLVVLCLARPDLLERRPSWGGGRRNSLNLALEPLADEDIALVVGRLLESEPPPQLRDRIVERSAGNPFFAEELVRALLERGPLDLRDPAAVDRALAALPETVQATVLARIDMLSPEERAVLTAAAVIGRQFPSSVLRAICEIDGEAVDATLARLVERELLTRMGGSSYAFRHPLLREVAYATLPRTRRARDHALVARHLDRTARDRADEQAALIGLHYLEATRLLRASAVPMTIEGLDAEDVRASAVRWVTRGARMNAAAGAWADAISQLEGLDPFIRTDDERIAVLLSIGEISVGGDIGWDSLAEALRLWRTLADGDPATGARIIVEMLVTLFRSGVSISPEKMPDGEGQKRLADEALTLARRSGDEGVLAKALYTHAYLERSRSDRTAASLERAAGEARDAAAILERRGDLEGWSQSHDVWAAIVGDLGDLRSGREIAVARADRADSLSPLEAAHAYWTMPLYDMALGHIDAALSYTERAYRTPALQDAHWSYNTVVGQVFLLAWRAGEHWALGAWDEAVADMREALAPLGQIPAPSMRSVFSHAAAAALFVARRRDDRELLDVAVSRVRGWCDDPRVLALVADDVASLDGEIERVATAGIDAWIVERSLSLLNAYGRAPSGPVDAFITDAERRGLLPTLAQLLRLRARSSRVAADARRAHEILTTCGMRGDAALAGVETALLGDRSLLAASRVELERLGDRRGLALLASLGEAEPV